MRTRKIAFAGVVGALYAALTIALAPIAYGPIQFRIAEALCVLPFYFPISVPGLFAGCVISNLFSPYGVLDIITGSFSTLISALLTMWLGRITREKLIIKAFACFPPVIINALIVGFVMAWTAGNGSGAFWHNYAAFGIQVGAGELAVMYLIGLPLAVYLPKTKLFTMIDLSEVGR